LPVNGNKDLKKSVIPEKKSLRKEVFRAKKKKTLKGPTTTAL